MRTTGNASPLFFSFRLGAEDTSGSPPGSLKLGSVSHSRSGPGLKLGAAGDLAWCCGDHIRCPQVLLGQTASANRRVTGGSAVSEGPRRWLHSHFSRRYQMLPWARGTPGGTSPFSPGQDVAERWASV